MHNLLRVAVVVALTGCSSSSSTPSASTQDGSATSPFVGTWSCAETISSDAGGVAASITITLTISAGANGEVSATASQPDGGVICALTESTSGNTATVSPNNQSCTTNGQTISIQSGTSTVNGNTLTFSETVAAGSVIQNASATCTRQ